MKVWIRRRHLEKLTDPNFYSDMIQLFTYKPGYEGMVQVEITEIKDDARTKGI